MAGQGAGEQWDERRTQRDLAPVTSVPAFAMHVQKGVVEVDILVSQPEHFHST